MQDYKDSHIRLKQTAFDKVANSIFGTMVVLMMMWLFTTLILTGELL